MKIVSRFMLVGLALAALTCGWFHLYTHSNAVDVARQNQTLALLKDLKQIDSDWNADALKSQSEINLSYDPLVVPLHRFAAIIATLKTAAAAFNDDKVGSAVDEIERLIGEKSMLIDRFKAQNSLLKNSLRYVPTANKELRGTIQAMLARGTSAPDVGALANLESSVGMLVSDALRYNAVPEAETADQLWAGMDKMRTPVQQHPGPLRAPIANLLSHLHVILGMRAGQTALLTDIAQVPVVAQIDRLNNMLSAHFEAELAEQFRYHRLLLGYSAFALLLVFGAAGLIAHRNATERERLASLVIKQTLELRHNEAQLVHAQKMNALGEMVAGITHEINTPLAAVKSGLQSAMDVVEMVRVYIDESAELTALLASCPADEAGRSMHMAAVASVLDRTTRLREEINSFDAIGTMTRLFGESIRNVDYIHQVIVNMLNFSRLDRSKICSVKVEEGIDSVLLIANHMIRNARVSKRYGNTRPVHCDIAQINQVVLNLVKNAAQALPAEGGNIIIETTSFANELRVAVSDNGAGIPDEILARIWEPFFTTRRSGSGTGLGLSTCKKIIEAHGGRIDVATEAGKGTTFTIVLPTTPPESLYEELGEAPDSRLLVA